MTDKAVSKQTKTCLVKFCAIQTTLYTVCSWPDSNTWHNLTSRTHDTALTHYLITCHVQPTVI